MKHYFFLALFLLSVHNTSASLAFICADGFRQYAQFVFDDTTTFNPYEVQKGDVVFVKTDRLSTFFDTMHPCIPERYILITHNSDHRVSGKFLHYLNDKKLIAWFAKNALESNPKLHPIPIGVANKTHTFGNSELLEQVINEPPVERDYLLYVNFHTGKGRPNRKDIFKKFSHKSFCTITKRKPFKEYLRDLKRSVFVLCPSGSGFDCYRTWEALLCGAYPIVEHSRMDRIFDGLPVVLVHTFNEVTEAFLQKKLTEFSVVTNWQWEKLTMPYWINRIDSFRNV